MEEKYSQEVDKGFSPDLVSLEASRCLLCLDAPCSKHCPAGTDPAKFIRSVRFKNFEGAAETIRENNPLGAICALVCPTEKYCQLACSRCGIDKPIDIGKIQRYVTEYESLTKMKILEVKEENGKRIAIIGSGPSGLTVATKLRCEGYDVTIYDQYPKAGGYLRYGIPEFRLPSDVLNSEIKRIKDLGVKFELNQTIDNERLEALKKDNDAVVLAIGFSKGKMLEMFEGSRKVKLAVDFLKEIKTKKGNMKLPETALVIGGGDVAMDCVASLKLCGVENVTDVVYEQFKEFRASKKELELARNLNVSIIDGYVPTKFQKNGTVTFKHRVIDSEIKVKADLIILAVGQLVDTKDFNLKFNKNEIEGKNYRVGNTNLFYSGDIANGDKTVVYGVKTGKEVANEIIKYLGGK